MSEVKKSLVKKDQRFPSSQHVAEIEEIVFAKVPKFEQQLNPWRSIVHWPETWHEHKDRYRWLVPVTCGVCQRRRDMRLMWLRESDLLSDYNLAVRGEAFTGLCRKCATRMFPLEDKLGDGSKMSKWELTKQSLPIICGKCNTSQVVKFDSALGIDADFTWTCHKCGHTIGEQLHSQGA